MKRLCLMICVFWVILPGADPAGASSFSVEANISYEGDIMGICLSPDDAILYAACWEDTPTSRVLEYDLSDYSLLQTIGFGSYHTHGDVVVSADGRYLFTTNYYPATVSRIDLQNNKARTDLPAGNSWPGNIDITPDKSKAIVTVGQDGRSYDMNNDGVSVFDIQNGAFTKLATITLPDEPQCSKIAFSPDSQYAYIVTYHRKSPQAVLYEVSIIGVYEITRSLELPSLLLTGVALVGDEIYVSDWCGFNLWIVNRSTFNITSHIDLGAPPTTVKSTLASHPNGKDLYVLIPGARKLLVFDTTTKSVVDSFEPLNNDCASDIEFNHDGTKAYISHMYTNGGITVLDIGEVENEPPIADAGDDVVADANEEVTLDGSNSYDPDGEIIRYTWKRLPDKVVIYSGEDPNCQARALGRVEEIIELTVTDNYWATATDTVRIVSRTTQDLKDQVAAMQSQIEELQQQIQELQALVDKIVSWPPVRKWLEKSTDAED